MFSRYVKLRRGVTSPNFWLSGDQGFFSHRESQTLPGLSTRACCVQRWCAQLRFCSSQWCFLWPLCCSQRLPSSSWTWAVFADFTSWSFLSLWRMSFLWLEVDLAHEQMIEHFSWCDPRSAGVVPRDCREAESSCGEGLTSPSRSYRDRRLSCSKLFARHS